MLKPKTLYFLSFLLYGLLLAFFWNRIGTFFLDVFMGKINSEALLLLIETFIFMLFLVFPLMIAAKLESKQIKQLEDSLKWERIKNETMAFQSADGMCVIHIQKGLIVEANKNFCEMMGYAEDEMKGLSIQDILGTDMASLINDFEKRKKSTDSFFMEEQSYKRKDGSMIEVNVRGSAVDRGNEKLLLVYTSDLSGEKVTERKLNTSVLELNELTSQYSYIADNIEEVIYKLDLRGNIVYLNKAWEQVFGFKIKDSLGRNYCEFLCHEDMEKAKALESKQLLHTLEFRRVTLHFLTNTGEVKHCEVNCKLSVGKNGIPNGIIGTLHDLTEQRNILKETLALKEQLSFVYNSVADSIFLLEVEESNYIIRTVNKTYINNFDVKEEDAINQDIKKILPSDVIPNIITRFKQVASTEEMQIYEENLTAKDGTPYVYRTRLYPVRNQNSDNLFLLGVSTNITDQKKAEEQLEESQQKYKSLFEYNQNTSFILDPNGRFTEVNGVAERLSGYKDGELIGIDAKILLADADECTIKEKIMTVIRGQAVDFQTTIKHKMGMLIHLHVNMVPFVAGGAIRGVIGVAADITQQLEAEKKMKEANELLRELSMSDGLTGISNRRHFDQIMDKEWERAREIHSPISLIMIDIDHFKSFNDLYGHLQGDECIKSVATNVKKLLGNQDGCLARYGGEEFGIILPGKAIQEAMEIAKKVVSGIEQMEIPHKGSCVKPYITLSAGAATIIPTDGMDSSVLIEHADNALYQSKRDGRNRVTEYVTMDMMS